MLDREMRSLSHGDWQEEVGDGRIAWTRHTIRLKRKGEIIVARSIGREVSHLREFSLASVRFQRLSDREVELFEFIRAGHTVKEISRLFGLAPGTITKAKSSIAQKLGLVSFDHDAATMARTLGIGQLSHYDLQAYDPNLSPPA